MDIVIDTAPAASILQAAALYAADLVLIPAACDRLSQHAIVDTLETIEYVREHRAFCLAVVPNLYRHTRAAVAALQELRHNLTAVLPPIYLATVIAEASAAGRTVRELAPRSRATTQLAGVTYYVQGVIPHE